VDICETVPNQKGISWPTTQLSTAEGRSCSVKFISFAYHDIFRDRAQKTQLYTTDHCVQIGSRDQPVSNIMHTKNSFTGSKISTWRWPITYIKSHSLWRWMAMRHNKLPIQCIPGVLYTAWSWPVISTYSYNKGWRSIALRYNQPPSYLVVMRGFFHQGVKNCQSMKLIDLPHLQTVELNASGTNQPPNQWIPEILSQCVKHPECAANQSLLSGVMFIKSRGEWLQGPNSPISSRY